MQDLASARIFSPVINKANSFVGRGGGGGGECKIWSLQEFFPPVINNANSFCLSKSGA